MMKYKCPNCFHTFKKQEVLFRCSAISQICPHVEDEVYNTFHKEPIEVQGRVLGKHTSGKRNILKRVLDPASERSCENCATVTRQRLCPHCHHTLPEVFWSSSFIPIGVMCKRPQELETYMRSLKQVLEKTLAHDLGYMINPEASATPFDLYLESVGDTQKTRLSLKTSKVLHIRFYPMDPKNLEKDFLGFDGVLLLCDKLDAAQGRTYVPEAVENLILTHQNQGQSNGSRPKDRTIPMPLGVVYNCFENLAPLLPPAHPLFQQGRHNGGYNQKDGARISSEMLAYTGYWFGPNLLHLMKRYFPTHRLFCQSFAYPEMQPLLPNSGWRIEDPFLWILHSIGRLLPLR